MVTILVNSPGNFYKQNIDQFINQDSKGNISYEAASQLIQGPHFASIFDDYTASFGIQYSQVSKDPNIQNLVIHLSKLLFFGHSLVNESMENIEWLARIAVQIASINIETGKKLIHDLLSYHSNEPKYFVYWSIAVKAALIIFDNSSGFQQYAKSNQEADFSKVINEIPIEFETYLQPIYTSIDSLVGINQFGPNGSLVENIIHKEIDSIDIYKQQLSVSGVLLAPKNKLNTSSSLDVEQKITLQSFQRQASAESLKIVSPMGSCADLDNSPIVTFDDANAIVSNTLASCFLFLDEQPKNVSKYALENALSDNVKQKKNESSNTTREQKLAIALLVDVFKVLQYVPCIIIYYL
jgi:hypothetical protein